MPAPEIHGEAVADRLLTFQEVKDRLRKTDSALRWMIYIGTAPKHAKIGNRITFRESDVEAFINKAFED